MQSDLVRIRHVRHAVGVSCFIVPEERMRQLNNQHRQIDAPTDMLSFPLGYAAPGTGWVLGDIVICLDAVADKAGASANSLDDQLAFSLVHSLLHLVGYDHRSERDRGAMEAREEEVFGRLSIPTGLARRAS
jgi:probable rRNA maturation factor